MTLITVGCVKGRSGATATSLGLAAVLPETARPLLVECDPAGGDLALRFSVKWNPGLVALASGARATSRPTDPAGSDPLIGYAHLLPVGDGVPAVCAPPAGGQTQAAVSLLAANATNVLRPADRTVIADCGRLDPASAAWPLLGIADVAIVVLRGRIEDAGHLRGLIGDLAELAGPRLVLMLTAGGVYGPSDIGGTIHRVLHELGLADLRIPVLGPLPYDAKAAQLLDGQSPSTRRWRRTPLLRALDTIADGLAARTTADGAVPR
jgi:hypothetical protein